MKFAYMPYPMSLYQIWVETHLLCGSVWEGKLHLGNSLTPVSYWNCTKATQVRAFKVKLTNLLYPESELSMHRVTPPFHQGKVCNKAHGHIMTLLQYADTHAHDDAIKLKLKLNT